jgi:FtsZ-binding cell division protein ZapB
MTARSIPLETEAEPERAARLARECQQLDEAREDVRTGRVIADEDVDAWLDRLRRDESLPEAPAEAPALPPSE